MSRQPLRYISLITLRESLNAMVTSSPTRSSLNTTVARTASCPLVRKSDEDNKIAQELILESDRKEIAKFALKYVYEKVLRVIRAKELADMIP